MICTCYCTGTVVLLLLRNGREPQFQPDWKFVDFIPGRTQLVDGSFIYGAAGNRYSDVSATEHLCEFHVMCAEAY